MPPVNATSHHLRAVTNPCILLISCLTPLLQADSRPGSTSGRLCP
jgi:hypothetical protein